MKRFQLETASYGLTGSLNRLHRDFWLEHAACHFKMRYGIDH